MRNVTKALAGIALMIATITTASPALASNGYVCEGRVAYKDCGDHMEVWDYCDPGLTTRPTGSGSYFYDIEQMAKTVNKTIVDWDYDTSGAYSGSGYDNPWQLTLTNADGSRMWTTSAATGSVEIAPHTIAPEPNTGTNLVIPARVNGKPVTALRRLAFGSALLPSDPMRGRVCKATTIDLSATSITSIPAGGFNACTDITSVRLPNTVTSIGEGAFKWVNTLKSINTPTSLKTVGKGAFSDCSKSIQAQFAEWTTASSGGSSSSSQGASDQGPSYNVMYRLYNPNSGEHFYTANRGERDATAAAGWTYEGHGWKAPTSGKPVYRLYSGTDHHYTTSATERDKLVSVGWTYEGIGWYSADSTGVPLYRQFNPNVQPWAERNNSGSHNYTTDKGENDTLVTLGWRAEGIGWYGMR